MANTKAALLGITMATVGLTGCIFSKNAATPKETTGTTASLNLPQECLGFKQTNTGSKATALFHWTDNPAALNPQEHIANKLVNIHQQNQNIQMGRQPDGGMLQVGLGIYLASDPAASTPFGRILLMGKPALNTQAGFLDGNDMSNGVPDPRAIRCPFPGIKYFWFTSSLRWITDYAYVAREPAAIDIASFRAFDTRIEDPMILGGETRGDTFAEMKPYEVSPQTTPFEIMEHYSRYAYYFHTPLVRNLKNTGADFAAGGEISDILVANAITLELASLPESLRGGFKQILPQASSQYSALRCRSPMHFSACIVDKYQWMLKYAAENSGDIDRMYNASNLGTYVDFSKKLGIINSETNPGSTMELGKQILNHWKNNTVAVERYRDFVKAMLALETSLKESSIDTW